MVNPFDKSYWGIFYPLTSLYVGWSNMAEKSGIFTSNILVIYHSKN